MYLWTVYWFPAIFAVLVFLIPLQGRLIEGSRYFRLTMAVVCSQISKLALVVINWQFNPLILAHLIICTFRWTPGWVVHSLIATVTGVLLQFSGNQSSCSGVQAVTLLWDVEIECRQYSRSMPFKIRQWHDMVILQNFVIGFWWLAKQSKGVVVRTSNPSVPLRTVDTALSSDAADFHIE